ncbi:hypothetical protein [Streptomyces virginiae]|uniref:hypothetical protein n=1 Tax=Streptomyces virginiae TaxID=1961 RepID=UPI002255B9E5|nr:hypothetical protein [Streptomyces virginiae]MCX4959083.1 hypothetical protein [Streptomyces virginiae]
MPQYPIRRHELMDELEGASAPQPVAVASKDFCEGKQLASGWALKQLSCRRGAVADQLRCADQLVLGG